MLSAVKFRMHSLLERSSEKQSKFDELAEVQSLLEKTLQEVRRISQNLRPSVLDDLGLVSAVRTLCDDFKQRTRIDVALNLPSGAQRFPPEIELALFRIIQEVLNNAEKHSGATALSVDITRFNSSLDVLIRDNGKGFDPEMSRDQPAQLRGIGLDSVRERASSIGAVLEITSKPNAGSTISLRVPLLAPPHVHSTNR
ncbi:MAG: sensor histidine kinase, partial [Bacteroidota bacterium]